MTLKRVRLLWLIALVISLTGIISAQDNPNGFPPPQLVVIPGTLQSEIGCDSDWDPSCQATALQDKGDGVWEATFRIPAGEYEYKVALNGGWDQNYGADAVAGGPNIPLTVPSDMDVTFIYDHKTGIILDSLRDTTVQASPPPARPEIVNIPGTIQSVLGCPGPWAPDCEATFLEYNETFDVWTRTFDVPAGQYEYKVAINGSWTENYGAFADAGGPNIVLNVPEDTSITFTYDHKTNWISDSIRHVVATVPGSYQSELGCSDDWQPECLRSWLQDVDGDGIYTLTVRDLPAGDYEAKVALNLSPDQTYGAGGAPDGANMTFNVPADGTPVTFTFDPNQTMMVITAGGGSVSGANLRAQRAHWVLENTLAWQIETNPDHHYRLLYSLNAAIELSLFGLGGEYETLDLSYDPSGLPSSVMRKFPHLEGYSAFKIADESLDLVPQLLKGQVVIAAFDASDNLLDITGLQIPGVLDDLYTYDGKLGVAFHEDNTPHFYLWAPTAQNVRLHVFDDSNFRTEPQIFDMTYSRTFGVWDVMGQPDWYGKYYLYEVTVYAPSVVEVVTNLVTDPYSVSLAMNSARSHIVDLNDPAFMPEGWTEFVKEGVAAPEDITIYELHIRDFSVFDESVPEDYRGTYMAFTVEESAGMQHLTALADAGLTHLHLLPSFDIATINENKRRWFTPDYEEMATFAPDSDQQQAMLTDIRDLDGFNWGYDPFHYNVPEGSYSTQPDGAARILEYRQMVMALHQAGLYVVQDVVYNHTNSAGQGERSVLDRIVPGYYHRLNERGGVWTSTCCQNTATEHNMMRRLMVDSVVLHAIHYKVDAFRFDLMGHHMVADMLEVRAALDALTLDTHGVDGEAIYVYGEGWNFGEVADNQRGANATQLNLGGTGIGTFNDRLRDAVRGGSPFGDRLDQGLANGQFTAPNGLADFNTVLEELLLHADQTRIGLAGNLSAFMFEDRNGEMVNGTQIDYNGAPSGYTLDPQENIVYVSKHDNEALFDNNAYKAPRDISIEDRVRMQILALGFTMYSQGVPFFHAGDDILRSKSMDRNSYNSGDWFNRIDWTYQTNNFGVGLPPAGDNQTQWEMIQPVLANPDIAPTPEAIMSSAMRFRDMLQVRYSTPLFRLQTAEDVMARLAFHNTGPDQMPGVIVMSLSDMVEGMVDLDPAHELVVVVFNTSSEAIAFTEPMLAGLGLTLHPVLANGNDEIMKSASFDAETGTLNVPALSAAVYVLSQSE